MLGLTPPRHIPSLPSIAMKTLRVDVRFGEAESLLWIISRDLTLDQAKYCRARTIPQSRARDDFDTGGRNACINRFSQGSRIESLYRLSQSTNVRAVFQFGFLLGTGSVHPSQIYPIWLDP